MLKSNPFILIIILLLTTEACIRAPPDVTTKTELLATIRTYMEGNSSLKSFDISCQNHQMLWSHMEDLGIEMFSSQTSDWYYVALAATRSKFDKRHSQTIYLNPHFGRRGNVYVVENQINMNVRFTVIARTLTIRVRPVTPDKYGRYRCRATGDRIDGKHIIDVSRYYELQLP